MALKRLLIGIVICGMLITENGALVSMAAGPNVSEPILIAKSTTVTATTGQKNALSKAKSYLKVMAFSHDGLVEQLEFEGYTHEEAVYGADNCGADWNAQALKKAKDYLKLMAFSESGLVEQLEFEGYSKAEAQYGVANCGADWNEQAKKKAESYLGLMSFSRAGLKEQLENEGFTAEQAEDGVSANGY